MFVESRTDPKNLPDWPNDDLEAVAQPPVCGLERREAPEHLAPLQRIKRTPSNGYFNDRFGTDFAPAHPLGAWLAWLTPWKRGELESAGRHLPKAKPGQSLLDVGCGNGIFLDFARSAGWQAQGIDFASTGSR